MAIKGKRTEIACIMCNNAIKLPEYIGQDYSGDLRCGCCESLLYIKLVKREVQQFKVRTRGESKKGQPSETLLRLQEMAKKSLAQPAKSNEPGDQSA